MMVHARHAATQPFRGVMEDVDGGDWWTIAIAVSFYSWLEVLFVGRIGVRGIMQLTTPLLLDEQLTFEIDSAYRLGEEGRPI
jgi:hypothetical protein